MISTDLYTLEPGTLTRSDYLRYRNGPPPPKAIRPVCIVCGRPFLSGHKQVKVCSRECHKARKAALERARK